MKKPNGATASNLNVSANFPYQATVKAPLFLPPDPPLRSKIAQIRSRCRHRFQQQDLNRSGRDGVLHTSAAVSFKLSCRRPKRDKQDRRKYFCELEVSNIALKQVLACLISLLEHCSPRNFYFGKLPLKVQYPAFSVFRRSLVSSSRSHLLCGPSTSPLIVRRAFSAMPPKHKKQPTAKGGNAASTLSGSVVIYWHRTDLRLHDSPALHAALDLKPAALIPVWTWDPHYVFRARVGPNRWQFLLDCQRDLSDSYTKLNPKQKLHVVREAPQTVFPKLFKKWNVTHLVFEKDTDGYARARDEEVTKLAKNAGVEVVVRSGRTLFDSDDLVKANGGKPTMSMGQTQKASEKINRGVPDKPLPTPESLPDPLNDSDMDLTSLDHNMPKTEAAVDINTHIRSKASGTQHYTSIMGPNNDFAPPTLSEMGIDPSLATTQHRGGEKIALKMLASYIANEDYTGTFEKPKTSPADFEPQATTLLSPHHHFGSLSIRKNWWDVQEVFEKRKKAKKPVSSIPVNLPGQFLFRDMYFGAQAAIGQDFLVARGNKVVRWVPWHLLSIDEGDTHKSNGAPVTELSQDGHRSYTVDSPEAEQWFLRWKEGRTGFPWIDALMRQLKLEGWIHHLGRHSVACFLTRGGCYVSWERGAEVFEEWLIDHEPACNAGNWMWLSCTAFFSQFYRCYSPIAFGKKWDPEGLFVKKYVPELAGFDKKYIYEPWKAPVVDQKKWGCLVKGDGHGNGGEADGMKTYPKPMFNFDERRQICLDGMKKAYDVGLYGDSPKVKNGEWKKLFGYSDKSAKVHDLNGAVEEMVERPAKKRKVGSEEQQPQNEEDLDEDERDAADEMAEDENAEGQADEGGEDEEAQRKEEKEGKVKSGKGKGKGGGEKKQATLDQVVGKKKAKR